MSVSHITVVLLHPSGTIFNWDVDIGTAFVFKNVCLVPFPWKYTRWNDRCRKENNAEDIGLLQGSEHTVSKTHILHT